MAKREWRYQPAEAQENGYTRYQVVDTQTNEILPDWWRVASERDEALRRDNASHVIEEATRALGDIRGQLVDLLADNFPEWPLDECQRLAELWKAANPISPGITERKSMGRTSDTSPVVVLLNLVFEQWLRAHSRLAESYTFEELVTDDRELTHLTVSDRAWLDAYARLWNATV